MYYSLCASEDDAREILRDHMAELRPSWDAEIGPVHTVDPMNLQPANRLDAAGLARWAGAGEPSRQWQGKPLQGVVLECSGPFARGLSRDYGRATSEVAVAWEVRP